MDKFLKILGLLVLSLCMFYVDLLMIREIYKLTMMPLGAPGVTIFQLFGVHIFAAAIAPKTLNYDKNETMPERIGKCFGKSLAILICWGLVALVF